MLATHSTEIQPTIPFSFSSTFFAFSQSFGVSFAWKQTETGRKMKKKNSTRRKWLKFHVNSVFLFVLWHRQQRWDLKFAAVNQLKSNEKNLATVSIFRSSVQMLLTARTHTHRRNQLFAVVFYEHSQKLFAHFLFHFQYFLSPTIRG